MFMFMIWPLVVFCGLLLCGVGCPLLVVGSVGFLLFVVRCLWLVVFCCLLAVCYCKRCALPAS